MIAAAERPVLAALLLFFVIAGSGGCNRAARTATPQERWQQAQRQWQSPDLSAGYASWVGLDGATLEGQEAHRRLDAASEHYRRALALIKAGQAGARQELSRGKAIAPMDPALFLPLARACRDKDNTFLAVQYYRSYLEASPRPAESDAREARQELAGLARDLGDIFGAAAPPPSGSLLSRVPPPAVLFLGTALGLLLALFLSILGERRRHGRGLSDLAKIYPELQPALAYLIGRLRHELLKHRIGAAADVAQALHSGQSTAEQRVFLHRKLYGGERIAELWQGYLESFRRALGPDFDLGRNRAFKSAQKAIRELEALELPLLRGEKKAARKLVAAHARLQDFDRGLAALVWRLQRTPLDKELLTAAVQSVRGEHLAGQVVLDVVEIFGPPEPVFVPVYRTDLMLILKNLLRNAILAVGRAPPPRQIAVDVTLDMLPTGEEVVVLRVHDSSPEPLSPEQIYRSGDAEAAGNQHGLSLVNAALGLYSGSILIEPGRDGYCKCVAVQLFRTLDAAEPGAEP